MSITSFYFTMIAIVAYGLGSMVLYVMFGALGMFRTALNDRLPPKSKLFWMLGQVYFAPTSIAYLAIVEKNRIVQAIATMLVVITAGGGWEMFHHATPAMLGGIEAGLSAISQSNQLWQSNFTPDMQRAADPLSSTAKQISSQLTAMRAAAVNDVDKHNLSQTRIALARLHMEYVYNKLPADQFRLLQLELQNMLMDNALSAAEAAQWESQANRVIGMNRSRQPAPGGAATNAPAIPAIPATH